VRPPDGIYVGLTTERADRPASPDAAADCAGRVGGRARSRATNAVLVAAGHGEPERPCARARHPVDLASRGRRARPRGAGLTTREIAERLVISPKTADRHIQNIYGKIGVSTRAAAALWAMQHDLVRG
jgi:DNA-binding NarL/FixJ family response regulator